MTRFEKDKAEILNGGNATVIMRERKAQLEKLYAEGKACRNAFRTQCIAQEYAKLQKEYAALDELI